MHMWERILERGGPSPMNVNAVGTPRIVERFIDHGTNALMHVVDGSKVSEVVGDLVRGTTLDDILHQSLGRQRLLLIKR
jgi:hypothetical protein